MKIALAGRYGFGPKDTTASLMLEKSKKIAVSHLDTLNDKLDNVSTEMYQWMDELKVLCIKFNETNDMAVLEDIMAIEELIMPVVERDITKAELMIDWQYNKMQVLRK
jgi:hypothetical protein